MGVNNYEKLMSFFKDPSKEDFDDVAKFLLKYGGIKKKIRKEYEKESFVYYRFKEIEFYLYDIKDENNIRLNKDGESEIINDCPTFNRNCKAGEWFFHNYGVDIAFETFINTDKGYKELTKFGGILIRSVERLDDGIVICGPRRCLSEIFNGTTALPEVCTLPENYESSSDDGEITILKDKRVLGKSWEHKYGADLPYRYYVADTDWEREREQIYEKKNSKTDEYHVILKTCPYKYKDKPLDQGERI